MSKSDEPRLLHKHSQYGYTESSFNAMPGEAEAVSADFQKHLTTEGHSRFAELREEDIRREQTRSALGRARKAANEAQKKGVDATPVLQKFVEELERLAA